MPATHHANGALSHFAATTASPISTTELFIPAGDDAPSSSSDISMGRTTGDHHHHPHKSHLEIILDAPYLTLKGTGPDVEPTSLSGHVALFLTESTSIKEITLQFRGKAKIPMPASESLINNSTSITYVVCNHDWSFLEGDKRHSRTLKAGRHFFPFHLEIGGTLPSSISTNALGGASVSYKLRASAVRPGLSHNLQANVPVHIVRSFTHEALEYQQTLEIENTWPEKLMYSIMLPHKAWAAGDTLIAVLKFSPISKGVSVASIVSSLQETTKTYARSGAQEDTRIVCSVRHEIVAGRAVEIDGDRSHDRPARIGQQQQQYHGFTFASTAASISATPAGSRPSSAQGHHPRPIAGPSSSTQEDQREWPYHDNADSDGEFENHDVVTYVKVHIPPSSYPTGSAPNTPSGTEPQPIFPLPSLTSSSNPTSPSTTTSPTSSSNPFNPSYHAVSASHSALVTPSHTLEPIVVSHRIRWSIFLRNRDGHTSELRCSLPVVILDGRIRDEARSMSVPTRRLMLSSVGLGHSHNDWAEDLGPGASLIGQGQPQHPLDDDDLEADDAALEADRELPSYTAHVRDRVANMFLPETVTVRVSNPWLSPLVGAPAGSGLAASADASPSGAASPANAYVMGAGAVGYGASTTTPAAVVPGYTSDVATPSAAGENENTVVGVSRTRSHSPEPHSHSQSSAGGSRAASTRSISTHDIPGVAASTRVGPFNSNLNPHPLSAAYQTIPHQLPPAPGVGEHTPLDWVNSELLLSLTDADASGVVPPNAVGGAGGGISGQVSPRLSIPSPVQPQYVAPQSALASGGVGGGFGGVGVAGGGGGGNGILGGSRWGSRAGSRPASPERHHHSHSHRGSTGASRVGSRAGSPVFGATTSGNASGASSVGGSGSAQPAAFGYGYEALPSAVGPSSSHSHGYGHGHSHSSSATVSSGSTAYGHPHPHAHAHHQHHQPHAHHPSLISVAPSALSTSTSTSTSTSNTTTTTSAASAAAGGGGAHGVRNLSSLFKATIKPFTALTHHHHHHSHHHQASSAHHGSHAQSPHSPHSLEREGVKGKDRESRDRERDSAAETGSPSGARSVEGGSSGAPSIVEASASASASGSSSHGHGQQDAPGNVYPSPVEHQQMMMRSASVSSIGEQQQTQSQQQQQHPIAPRVSTNPFYNLIAANQNQRQNSNSNSNNPFHHLAGAASTPVLPASASSPHLAHMSSLNPLSPTHHHTQNPHHAHAHHPAPTAPVSRSNSSANIPSLALAHLSLSSPSTPSPFLSSTPPTLSPAHHGGLLHRAITEVPDYEVAARGFIGGVPPLSSMRGLPSYEEAARGVGSGVRESQRERDEEDEEDAEEDGGIEMRRRR